MIYGDDNIHDAMEKLAGAQREAYALVKPKLLAALNARSPREAGKLQRAMDKFAPGMKSDLSGAQGKVMQRSFEGKGGPMSSFFENPMRSFPRGTHKGVLTALTRKRYRAPTATWTPKRMRGNSK